MISENISSFLNFIRETGELYRMSEMNGQEADDATQDILHSLELEEHDTDDFARLAAKLKEVREQRRIAKDTMYQSSPVCDWADDNQRVLKDLERLLGEVRKREKNTENRIYTPRTNFKEED